MDVTDIRCEARSGDLGASASVFSAASCGFTSESFSCCCSCAPSSLGTSGTGGSELCSRVLEDVESRLLISDRVREPV